MPATTVLPTKVSAPSEPRKLSRQFALWRSVTGQQVIQRALPPVWQNYTNISLLSSWSTMAGDAP